MLRIATKSLYGLREGFTGGVKKVSLTTDVVCKCLDTQPLYFLGAELYFYEHNETTFGKKWSRWSFNSREETFFRSSASEFEWREHSSWKYRSRTWGSSSDSESDDESLTVGSSSDRTVLGLPRTGPLKLEDVKMAFRLSALKWHPDKHPGPSQAMAEEKFKHCVDAYNSLCKVVSPA
ncbi:hypothetical protein TIFTF001_003985 [Ficus carica]|uniref:J domain-containing protein n=1 Tax=Ficus carica TaxID=3494 RepID=A0AA88A2N3_FICCA|nr:hypothetical protein TIFTF001_003985 [Ficus carica]